MDSEELAAPVDSEKVNENGVGANWKIIIETPSKGNTWMWKRRSCCWLKNSQWNNIQRWRVDSEELTAPVDSEKVNKNAVDADWEIVTETPSKGDA